MKNNIKIALALLGLISLSGNLQAQTVNLINNMQSFYMGNGTTLLGTTRSSTLEPSTGRQLPKSKG
jgi:hypothetical protein